MKKLICFAWLIASFSLGLSFPQAQGAVGSALRIDQPNERDIRVTLDLNGMVREAVGEVSFPPELLPYLREEGDLTMIVIHLVVADQGNYRAECKVWEFRSGSDNDDAGSAEEASESVLAPELIRLSKPYLIRDIRGVDLEITPYRYQDGKLLSLHSLQVTLVNDDHNASLTRKKIDPYFVDICKQHFSNFSNRYEDMREYGSMAVLCPPQFSDLIRPWVLWKNQKGILTTVYSTELSGSSYESTKAFIQNLYDNDPNLTFVQLVGDFAQIPCVVNGTGTHYGGRDADYTLLSGDDWYPDIFVGRFSAETPADLYTQIKRSLDYEIRSTSGEWLSHAVGVCSDLPPQAGDDGEHNWEHLDNIRAKLLNFGYSSVDRIYANEGAGTQDLISSLNEGKSYVNYCGEGYPTYWLNPRFYVDNAMALTNTDMLPFIHSVACHVGQFFNGTCLAEAFMRSRDPVAGEARGAIAMYAAAPSQGINMPMRAQDHSIDLLTHGTKITIGGLCYNGASNMLDVYGEEGGVYNFYGWNLFGDCSLVLRTRPADKLTAQLPERIQPGSMQLLLQTGKSGVQAALTLGGDMLASAFADSTGTVTLNWTEGLLSGQRLLLTLSGFNCVPFQQDIYCYAEDEPLILMTPVGSDTALEPGVVTGRNFRLRNAGTHAAQSIMIELSSKDPDFIPVVSHLDLASLAAGAQAELTLSFMVSRDAEDLSSLDYSLTIWNQSFNQHYDLSETVHTPELRILNIMRSPQCNWINPGDRFEINCVITNTGSAPLRELSGSLSSLSGDLIIDIPDTEILTLSVGMTDTLRFGAQVPDNAQSEATLSSLIRLSSLNTPVKEQSQTWLTIPYSCVQESFETGDLSAFPWDISPHQWVIEPTGLDGYHSLYAEGLGYSNPNLTIRFISREPGTVSFFYRKDSNSADDLWRIKLNGTETAQLEDAVTWTRHELSVPEGENFLTWEGNYGFTGVFALDAIQFPARTVFNDARPIVPTDSVTIVLAPGEIRSDPLFLSSLDGRYLEYNAILEANELESDLRAKGEKEESCLILEDSSGGITDQEVGVLILRANQNLLDGDGEDFTLRIYYNGNNSLRIPVSVHYAAEPAGFYDIEHLVCYPNPIRSTTIFAYGVPRDGEVELTIYNQRGQKVRTIQDGNLVKGYYRSSWDLSDSSGRLVSSGIYLCRLRSSSGRVKVIKCLVLR
ncbi:MAG TPA: C25 family cysteine peptidase [Candidatus Cloacimonadota bacterium]|nr:C25 family cysteine peptidase [Candidatus Cloacimonadota bacterium]